MRNVIRVSVLFSIFAVAAPLSSVAQTEKNSSKDIKKGDTISVQGCLSGTALQASDLIAPETARTLVSGITFRLTGDKALLKQLREKHDGKVVEVKGVLKSDLLQDTTDSRRVGKLKIAIGSPTAEPGRPASESQRSLPLLEVKSFDGGITTCGR